MCIYVNGNFAWSALADFRGSSIIYSINVPFEKHNLFENKV